MAGSEVRGKLQGPKGGWHSDADPGDGVGEHPRDHLISHTPSILPAHRQLLLTYFGDLIRINACINLHTSLVCTSYYAVSLQMTMHGVRLQTSLLLS